MSEQFIPTTCEFCQATADLVPAYVGAGEDVDLVTLCPACAQAPGVFVSAA